MIGKHARRIFVITRKFQGKHQWEAMILSKNLENKYINYKAGYVILIFQ